MSFKEFLEKGDIILENGTKYKKGDIILKNWTSTVNMLFKVRKVEKTYLVCKMEIPEHEDYENYTVYNIKFEYILPPTTVNMKKLSDEYTKNQIKKLVFYS